MPCAPWKSGRSKDFPGCASTERPTSSTVYFEGGYNPKKVGFIPRMIVRMLTRSLSKKADMTEADMRILETASGMDRTDKRMIAPLLAYINSKNE